jgi:hypothetical protein
VVKGLFTDRLGLKKKNIDWGDSGFDSSRFYQGTSTTMLIQTL